MKVKKLLKPHKKRTKNVAFNQKKITKKGLILF